MIYEFKCSLLLVNDCAIGLSGAILAVLGLPGKAENAKSSEIIVNQVFRRVKKGNKELF
jgi:hypothetical protein